ncbi:Phox-like protein [Pisolithus orientalis]|uniref:Phox-like protein n=1 Tax=Pisolithus orientalis TaxID=936130 RepID=UPI002225B220|nr:Phox-like protein [Pisolithus orientalis]KAI6010835.1 Phox-like protein [Pisolithus orientalis]
MQSSQSSSVQSHFPSRSPQSDKEQLVLIPDRIDVEEESRLYDELEEDEDVNESSALQSSPGPPSIHSRDIWLGDHVGQSAVFSRDVRISGWTSVGDQLGGAFIVYDCAIRTKEGITIHAHKRFNDFVELYHTLKHTLPRHLLHFIPPLPPKSPFARYRPAFLDHRRRQLQSWLSVVLLHPEIGACQAVRHWVLD